MIHDNTEHLQFNFLFITRFYRVFFFSADDFSRVKLISMHNDEGADYINANYIPVRKLLQYNNDIKPLTTNQTETNIVIYILYYTYMFNK